METDLGFSNDSEKWPIRDERCLEQYGERVAGTVAELCIHLIYVHAHARPPENYSEIKRAGRTMGVALQYINIARDVKKDAEQKRVYLPTEWLDHAGISHEKVLEDPDAPEVQHLKHRLLNKAMMLYREALPLMDSLPPSGRAPLKVAVESYVEIGRVMQDKGYRFQRGRATVPRLRRLRVAWNALSSG